MCVHFDLQGIGFLTGKRTVDPRTLTALCVTRWPGQPQQSRWEEGKRCHDLDGREEIHIMAHASFEPQKMDGQCVELHVGFACEKSDILWAHCRPTRSVWGLAISASFCKLT